MTFWKVIHPGLFLFATELAFFTFSSPGLVRAEWATLALIAATYAALPAVLTGVLRIARVGDTAARMMVVGTLLLAITLKPIYRESIWGRSWPAVAGTCVAIVIMLAISARLVRRFRSFDFVFTAVLMLVTAEPAAIAELWDAAYQPPWLQFFTSPLVILCLTGIAAAIAGAALLSLRYGPQGELIALLALLMVSGVNTATASVMRFGVAGSAGGRTLPDIFIVSVDSMRHDALESMCARRLPGVQPFCQTRSRHENVVSTGVTTYEILDANVRAGEGQGCAQSLPGLLSARGYDTMLLLGRRNRATKSAPCFDQFFNGSAAKSFSLSTIALGMSDPLRGLRAKYTSAEELLDKVEDWTDDKAQPVFVYTHLLEPHAPYVPTSARGEQELRDARAFLSRCAGPTLCAANGDPENSRIAKSARLAYDATFEDVDRAIARVRRIAESRGRPFAMVLTADHGELFGEHGGYFHTGGFVPELLAVPFRIWSPTQQLPAGDCGLKSSRDALWSMALTFGDQAEHAPAVDPSSVRINSPFLGTAVVDGKQGRISYELRDHVERFRGSARNFLPEASGDIPFPLRACPPLELDAMRAE